MAAVIQRYLAGKRATITRDAIAAKRCKCRMHSPFGVIQVRAADEDLFGCVLP